MSEIEEVLGDGIEWREDYPPFGAVVCCRVRHAVDPHFGPFLLFEKRHEDNDTWTQQQGAFPYEFYSLLIARSREGYISPEKFAEALEFQLSAAVGPKPHDDPENPMPMTSVFIRQHPGQAGKDEVYRLREALKGTQFEVVPVTSPLGASPLSGRSSSCILAGEGER